MSCPLSTVAWGTLKYFTATTQTYSKQYWVFPWEFVHICRSFLERYRSCSSFLLERQHRFAEVFQTLPRYYAYIHHEVSLTAAVKALQGRAASQIQILQLPTMPVLDMVNKKLMNWNWLFLKVQLWKRYIDDTLCFYESDTDNILEFITYLKK